MYRRPCPVCSHELRWLLFAAACCLPAAALAACKLNFPTPELNLGDARIEALAASDVPGFRQMGPVRASTLTLVCDADRPAVVLRFTNITGIGNDLMRWNGDQPVAALRMRIVRATADGTQVMLLQEGRAPQVQADIVRDQTALGLDLTRVGGKGRNFVLELQVTGLVANGFVPISRMSFTANPQVQLLDP